MTIYQVVEQNSKMKRTYTMGFESEKMLTEWLNSMQNWYGYIEGMGGDRSYSIVAWELGKDAHNHVDMERIWNLYGDKRKAWATV